MSYKFTLQSLVEKTRRAEQRAAKNRAPHHQTRKASRGCHHQAASPKSRQPILPAADFPVDGEPLVEHCGRKLTLVTQRVTNSIEEEVIASQLEQYTDDLCIYLRLTHEQSALFTCIKLSPFQRVDHSLHQISSETNQLLASIRTWRAKQQTYLHVAEQILSLMRDWYQAFTAWDNQCIELAQAYIEQHWTPHMLYRLSYFSNANPTQPDHAALGGSSQPLIASIVTCTEPSGSRISYITIDEEGNHGLKIILGGLLNYEPLVFHSKPEINQPLPYHVNRTVGQHSVYLPPCEIDCHKPPQPPPGPPDLSIFLSENGVEPLIAGTLGFYLDEEIDHEEAIQTMLKLTPQELVELNPDGIFSL